MSRMLRLRRAGTIVLSWLGLACACERECCRVHQPWLRDSPEKTT